MLNSNKFSHLTSFLEKRIDDNYYFIYKVIENKLNTNYLILYFSYSTKNHHSLSQNYKC